MSCGLAQDQPDPVVLRPTNGSSIALGPSNFIARAAAGSQLTVDGKTVELVRRGDNAVSAILDLAAGAHELKYGGETIRFAVGATDGFRAFRDHPGHSCGVCHVANGAKWEIKNGSPGDNCFACHKRGEQFEKRHSHTPEIVKDCGWCHATHGSTEAFHLKMSKEKACKLCHT